MPIVTHERRRLSDGDIGKNVPRSAHDKARRVPMRKLTREEEIELRRIANQSLRVDARLAHRLVQFKLVERFKDGWRLTPLGRQHYRQVSRSLLLQRSPSLIDGLLERAIPLARQLGIPQPDPVPDPAKEDAGDSGTPDEIDSDPSTELRRSEALCSEFLKARAVFRQQVSQAKTENDRAIAKSRATLNRSWLLLANTTRMVR